MPPNPEDSNRRGRDAASDLREMNEERWAELVDETVLTKRQVEIWELAVRYDLKQMYIASECGIKESTVSRHVERVREKADQVDDKIEELQTELQRWKKTKEYLDQ